MLRRLSISKQGIIGIGLLLVIEWLFVGMLAMSLNNTKFNLEKERRAREVVSRLNNVANISQKIGIAMIRSGSPPEILQFVESITDYHIYMKDLDREVAKLKELVRNDPGGLQKLDDLDKKIRLTCSYYDSKQGESRRTPTSFSTFTTEMFRRSEDFTNASRNLIKDYRMLEQSKPEKTSKALNNVTTILIVGVIFNLAGAVVFTLILVSRITGRMAVLTDNINRFANGEPLHRRLPNIDEIGKIDALFHEMTAAIAQAHRNETALIANASEVICQLDQQGVFTAVSPSVKTQWGYEAGDLIGAHFSTVIKEKHIEKVAHEISNLVSTSARGSFEAHVRSNQGRFIDTMWSACWSPSEESLFCFVHNIEERKNMEALLTAQEEQVRTAIENIPVGLMVIDKTGLIKSVNITTEKMSVRSRQDLIDRPILSIIDVPFQHNQDLLVSLDKAGAAHPVRCLLKQPDGENLPIDMAATPFPASEKDDRLLILDDISERVKLESMKEDFVNLLGHSLRAPLNATRLRIAELLDINKENTKKHERLLRICTNIERLLRLIDELLSIEKLGAGKLVGRLEPVDVHKLTVDAMEAIRDHAEQQGISLICQPLKSLVMADSERLVQVIVNLLGNAIKFSPRQSTVELSVEERPEHIEFSIIDSGRGIARDMQGAIFAQYVQTTASDGRRGKGTGLGLSICKSIVEAHNGSIGVESEEGKGSRFWFTIPKLSSLNSK